MTDAGENGTADDEPDEQADHRALHEYPLSLDALLDNAAHAYRRDVVAYLRDAPDGTASFEEVARDILVRRARATGAQPNHDEVEMSLLHVHLPKLADAGVIEFDVRSGTIRYLGDDRLETLLDRIDDLEGG